MDHYQGAAVEIILTKNLFGVFIIYVWILLIMFFYVNGNYWMKLSIHWLYSLAVNLALIKFKNCKKKYRTTCDRH